MGRYRTIVADPPWPIGDFPVWHDESRRSTRERELGSNPTPYPTMSLDEIKALPIAAFAEPDAHLYLWTINDCLFCRRQGVPGHIEITSRLADAADEAGLTRADVDRHMGTNDMAGWWLSRLDYRARVPTPEQWDKLKRFLGIGDDMDETYEALRQAERWKGERSYTRWFQWPRGRHSAKPEAFLDVVEQVSPPPRLEIFARRARFGWDYAGDGSLGTVEIPGLRAPNEEIAA